MGLRCGLEAEEQKLSEGECPQKALYHCSSLPVASLEILSGTAGVHPKLITGQLMLRLALHYDNTTLSTRINALYASQGQNTRGVDACCMFDKTDRLNIVDPAQKQLNGSESQLLYVNHHLATVVKSATTIDLTILPSCFPSTSSCV